MWAASEHAEERLNSVTGFPLLVRIACHLASSNRPAERPSVATVTAPLRGKQLEGIAMGWPDGSHMPVVDGRELRDAEAFGGGDHRGVHDPEREALVGPDQRSDPRPVLVGRVLDRQLVGDDGVEEPGFGVRADLRLREVADLGDDQARTIKSPS